eukprot:gene5085-5326_t
MGHDGTFKVAALGFPSCERREELPAVAQKLNFFGSPLLSPDQQALLEVAEVDHANDRLLFLANVWLDRKDTFEALHSLFMGLQDAGMVPAMIIMMGNFSAAAAAGGSSAGGGGLSSDFVALRDGFSQLARLIDTYRDIRDGSRFVFVPGPADPGLGQILPQPRLPTYFTAELHSVLPTAVFATNPCRIKYFSREVVVFRHDLLKAVRRRCVMPLADSSPQASFKHNGCTVFNPGCLQQGLFAAYLPIEDEVEPSELPGAAAATQLELEEDEDLVADHERGDGTTGTNKQQAAEDTAAQVAAAQNGGGGSGNSDLECERPIDNESADLGNLP